MSHTTESHRQVHVPRLGMVNVPAAVADRIAELEAVVKSGIEHCPGCEGSGMVFGPDEHSGMWVGTGCLEWDEAREVLAIAKKGGKT